MPDRPHALTKTDIMQQQALLRFERLPSAYSHPAHLGECLPSGLPVELRKKLLNSRRLQPRLSRLLMRRFDLRSCMAEDLAAPEAGFAQLEGEALSVAVRRIGAIYHARTIAAVILSESVKELTDWLGQDVYRDALRHRALAPVGADQDIIDGPAKIELLCRHIERDGQHCLEAWCRGQPASLGKRLLLKLPPVPEADEETLDQFQEQGPLIVDQVMKGRGDGTGH